MFSSVKRSIRNLVQLNVYDKPFHPEIAGGLERCYLKICLTNVYTIARKVEDVINNFEPRIPSGGCSCVSRLRS